MLFLDKGKKLPVNSMNYLGFHNFICIIQKHAASAASASSASTANHPCFLAVLGSSLCCSATAGATSVGPSQKRSPRSLSVSTGKEWRGVSPVRLTGSPHPRQGAGRASFPVDGGRPRRLPWRGGQRAPRNQEIPFEDSSSKKAVKGGSHLLDSSGDRGRVERAFQRIKEEIREEGEIEKFFGQLWWFPGQPNPNNPHPPNLCWIRKEVWESKKIKVVDCFPVLPGDMLKDEVKIENFARDFWGQGDTSFAQILKGGMVDRPGRGRGQGRGFHEEDQWSDQGWWNQGYPLP
jgi:hypothetical protein